MRDRLAVRHLPFGALGVDVYPLVVGRRLGELVDPVLVDHDPVGQADLLALQRFGIFNGLDYPHNTSLITQNLLAPQLFFFACFC